MKYLFLSLLVFFGIATNDLGAMKRRRNPEDECSEYGPAHKKRKIDEEELSPLERIRQNPDSMRISEEVRRFKEEQWDEEKARFSDEQSIAEITQDTFPELKELVDCVYSKAQALGFDVPDIKFFVLLGFYKGAISSNCYACFHENQWKVMLGAKMLMVKDVLIPFLIAHEIAHAVFRDGMDGGRKDKALLLCSYLLTTLVPVPRDFSFIKKEYFPNLRSGNKTFDKIFNFTKKLYTYMADGKKIVATKVGLFLIDFLRILSCRHEEYRADATGEKMIGLDLAKASMEEQRTREEQRTSRGFPNNATELGDRRIYNLETFARLDYTFSPSEEDRIENVKNWKNRLGGGYLDVLLSCIANYRRSYQL